MDLGNIQEQINNLEGSEKSKKATLKLIEIKTNSDMEKVLNAIGALKNEINTFNHKLESSIGALRDGILSNRNEIKTSFDSSRNEMKTSISSLRWTVITVCTATAAIVGLIVKFIK